MSFWKLVEKWLVTDDDPIPDNGADVIIGIGIDVSSDGCSASPYSRAVAQKSALLFRLGCARRIIFTGGYGKPGVSGVTEARGMANWLALYSPVPSNKVSLELQAKRTGTVSGTHLNADNVLPMLGPKEKTVIVVAQQWHARRVRAAFKKRWRGRGIDVRVVRAWSDYGGGSQRRLDHFWSFLAWDTLAFIISKLKGYC